MNTLILTCLSLGFAWCLAFVFCLLVSGRCLDGVLTFQEQALVSSVLSEQQCRNCHYGWEEK